MQLSVVLPCFNEEANIRATLEEVLAWAKNRTFSTEIVAVDDGSSDATPVILGKMAAVHPEIRVVRHRENGGYGRAVRSGCDAAAGEWIAFMDSDGQFRIADIELLLPHLEAFAFVTGRRRKRMDPLPRVVYGKVLAFFNLFVFGMWIRDVNCGLKVFRREIWQTIRPEHGIEKLFNAEMFLRLKKAGIPWKQVAVPHHPRRAGMPTGASGRALQRMAREVAALRRALRG
jgi:glycosyltransferase involved in cell wall biosynthesis